MQTLVEIGQKDEAPGAFGEDSEHDSAKMAWSAWLGYYNGMLRKIGMDKAQLVELSLLYANSIGLSQLPALPKKTIGKMGMQGVPGLRIETAAEAKKVVPRGGGGGGRGGAPQQQQNGGRGPAPQQQQQRPQTAGSSQQRGAQQQQQQGANPNAGRVNAPRASNSAGGDGNGGRPQPNGGGRGGGRR